jgi:hypothetical protein
VAPRIDCRTWAPEMFSAQQHNVVNYANTHSVYASVVDFCDPNLSVFSQRLRRTRPEQSDQQCSCMLSFNDKRCIRMPQKRALNPDNSSIPLFFVKLLKSVLIMIAVVLLYRIAIVLKIARFVRHLIAAESIILLSTLFEIFTVLFIWLYGLIALSGSSQNPPENLKSALDVIYSFDQASEAIRVILSFFSTFWLFLTWSLISRFPKEELPKELFASALGALGIAAAIVTGVSTAFQNVGALIFGRRYLVYTCGVPGRLWNVKNSINRTNEDITNGTTVELLSLGNSAAGILPFS